MEDHDFETLLRDIRAGHEHAFNKFYAQFGRRLVPYYLKTGLADNFGDAEDLAQEALIKVWRVLTEGRAEFFSPAALHNYIKQVARTVAIDHIRKMKRESGNVYLDDKEGLKAFEIPDSNPNSQQYLEVAVELDEFLETLSPAQRRAFILRNNEGYSYKEIADSEGCSIDAARGRVEQARKKFFEIRARTDDIPES